MKRSEPRLINDIIADYLKADGLDKTMTRHRACALWPDIVGPGINRLTARRQISDDGILHVYITSASLKQELTFMRASLIQALNNAVGDTAIRDIIIH